MRLVSLRASVSRVCRSGFPAAAVVFALLSVVVVSASTVSSARAEEPSITGPGGADVETASEADDLRRALATAPDTEAAAAIRRRLVGVRMRSGSATADLLTGRAAAARLAGDGALALDLLDAAIAVAPNWAGGRHLRGALHAERGEFAPAVVDLGEALVRDPTDAASLAMLAVLRERSGAKRAALDLMRRAAVLDPHLPDLTDEIERLSLEVEGRPI